MNFIFTIRLVCTFTLSLLFLTGCGSSSGGAGAGSTTGTTTATTSDVRKVVSTGNSLTFNNQTGGVNDLALQSNLLPAIAYYDKQAPISGTTAVGALKYAYMNSNGAWVVEVVDANYGTAACGTAGSFCIGAPNAAGGSNANILKLAFNSKGLPAIAYVFGASLAGGPTKQVRYAERSATGAWTISVAYAGSTAAGVSNPAIIATIDPMKAVTLNFDSANRPHITFAHYAQTITNSTVKYAFRNSGGVWSITDAFANVTGAGTITALAQGTAQSGAAFCTGAGPMVSNYVVNAIAGVGVPALASCTTFNATTGACTAFTNILLETGCSAGLCFSSGIAAGNNAGVRSDLILDPTTTKPIVGFYNTTTTTLVTGTLPNACAVAQPTAVGGYGAMFSVLPGAAAQGSNGFRIAGNATTQYAAYGTAAADMRLSVFTAGAWLAAGSIIEASAGIVGPEGVGLAFDATDSILYTSYAALPAALAGVFGNDIKVAYAQPADITTGSSGVVPLDVVDQLVQVFPSVAVPMLASAISANGTVGFAYFYQDATIANSKLYYGVKGGSDPLNPIFSVNAVADFDQSAASPAFVGSYPSLAYDGTNNPLLAYYDGNAAAQNLVLARSNNQGVSFSLTVVDRTVAQVGQFPSVSYYSAGNAIGIAYYDVTNTGLKFARYTPALGWKKYAVDGMTGAPCGNVTDDSGQFAKMLWTSTGTPVIAYQQNSVNLKLAVATESTTSATYTWSCVILDASAAARGTGIDMVLGTGDAPYITHFDATAGTIRYATCPNGVNACVTTGPLAFTSSIVGATGTLSTIVTKPSMQLSSNGTMYVAYYSAPFQGLAMSSLPAGGTAWTSEYIDQAQSGASFISAAGQYGSLLLNTSNYPMAFYRSNENWLKYFSRESVSSH